MTRVEITIGEGIRICPGDSLIIGFAHSLTPAEADYIQTICIERLPGVQVLVVGSVSSMAVQRGGNTDDDQPDLGDAGGTEKRSNIRRLDHRSG